MKERQMKLTMAFSIGMLFSLGWHSALCAEEVQVFEPLPQVETVSGAIAESEASANGTATQTMTDTQAAALETTVESRVPQAQLDLRDKRFMARERRDRMLELRAQTIQQLDQEQTQPTINQ